MVGYVKLCAGVPFCDAMLDGTPALRLTYPTKTDVSGYENSFVTGMDDGHKAVVL